LIKNHEKNSDYMKFFQMKKSKFSVIMCSAEEKRKNWCVITIGDFNSIQYWLCYATRDV